MNAADIHACLGSGWPNVLLRLGIPEAALRNRHGPCPACGGKDRFRFDNKQGRGDFICGQCGAGDGFALLMRVHGWDFPAARREVMEAAGIQRDSAPIVSPHVRASDTWSLVEEPACPSTRVLRIMQGSCAVEACDDAVAYLESRGLWPLPPNHTLRAHASVEYWDAGKPAGRYPALVAGVRDVDGQLVTAHVTYLSNGKKLAGFEPRKILSPLTGRRGCAVRLMPFDGGALGIAEGIETALSAARIHNMPVWAALNATLLGRFEPPPAVTALTIYADRDAAGFEAAARLMERLQGRVTLGLLPPPLPANDWNDARQARAR